MANIQCTSGKVTRRVQGGVNVRSLRPSRGFKTSSTPVQPSHARATCCARRLYSSAVFDSTFPRHGPPEIANTALEGVVLAMKSLAIDRVANFPFPSPPPPAALQVRRHAADQQLDGLQMASSCLGRNTRL